MAQVIVYKAEDGTIICESCATIDGCLDNAVDWDDLNDGTEQTPLHCNSCSEPFNVEKF
jgi:hypothetical protein